MLVARSMLVDQNMKRKANCICRSYEKRVDRLPVIVVMLFAIVPLLMFVLKLPFWNCGWLNRLKTSARTSSVRRSLTLTSFIMPISQVW